MTNDDLRAGDEDRDRTSATLREAYAEGRLDHDEFQGRLDRAQQAKTYGELAELTRDLPASMSVPAPSPEPPVTTGATISARERDRRKGLRAAWASWLGVSVMVNIIWFATWMGEGSAPYYWPIWVMGPWGGAMIIATLASGRDE